MSVVFKPNPDVERIASFLVGIGMGIDWGPDPQFVKAPHCLREPMARAAWEQNGRDPDVEDYAGLLDEMIVWEEPPTPSAFAKKLEAAMAEGSPFHHLPSGTYTLHKKAPS